MQVLNFSWHFLLVTPIKPTYYSSWCCKINNANTMPKKRKQLITRIINNKTQLPATKREGQTTVCAWFMKNCKQNRKEKQLYCMIHFMMNCPILVSFKFGNIFNSCCPSCLPFVNLWVWYLIKTPENKCLCLTVRMHQEQTTNI